MTKKQKITSIVLAISFVVMLVLYFAVLSPLVNEVVEDIKQSLNLDDGEVEGANNRVMLFEQVERANMKSIEVHNEHGTFRFVRDKDGNFIIEGNPTTSYDPQLFSQLVTDCGYTLSEAKVANNNPDKLSDYGLDEASNPAYYILTTKEDKVHKVYIGSVIPSTGGYYVKYEGRNTVYVLDETLETTVLAPIEAFVTPTIVFPTTITTYFMINDLAIYKGSYYFQDLELDKDDKDDKDKTDSSDTSADTSAQTDNEQSGEADGDNSSSEDKKPVEKIDPIVRFHYLDEKNRPSYNKNQTFYMDYPGNGVYVPSGYLDGVLQLFIAYEGSETIKLDPTDEDLKSYGLIDADYTLYLINNTSGVDEKGVTQYVPVLNVVYYSVLHEGEDGEVAFRYAYSVLFDTIVKVPYYDCEFLTYDLNLWVNNSLYNYNIMDVSSIKIESNKINVDFSITGGEDTNGDGSSDTAFVFKDNNGHVAIESNFKKFYQVILRLQKGGYVNMTDEELAAYIADENNLTARMTVTMESGKVLEYCFYSYGVQCYYTINGEGEFYVPTAQVNKVISDAIRVTKDEIVYPDNAY